MPDGKPGSRRTGATSRRPLGPWEKQHPEDQLFAHVAKKEEVGEVIRWAQVAILNPGTSPAKYRPGSNLLTSTSLEVKFSPNCVRVEVSELRQDLQYLHRYCC